MKPKYFLALGLLALGLGSCGESFFEQYPSNNITEGNFYKTDDDFNQGVVACYAKLKTQMSFHRSITECTVMWKMKGKSARYVIYFLSANCCKYSVSLFHT